MRVTSATQVRVAIKLSVVLTTLALLVVPLALRTLAQNPDTKEKERLGKLFEDWASGEEAA